MSSFTLRCFAPLLFGLSTFAAAAQVEHCQCDYADKAALAAGAEKVVADFVSQASKAAHTETGRLAVRVETTPPLIYFDRKHLEIVVPWWADLDPAVQGIFAELASDPIKGQHLFDMLFNRFFIAHEAGHWITFVTSGQDDATPIDFYQDELAANQLAVAYWMTTVDGAAFMGELSGVLEPILAKLPSPVPAGTTPSAYFNGHYEELGQNPPAYAWFQFRLVLDALAQRDTLKFARLVQSLKRKPAVAPHKP